MVISAPSTSLYIGAIHLGALCFILDPLRNSIWDQMLSVPWFSLHASGPSARAEAMCRVTDRRPALGLTPLGNSRTQNIHQGRGLYRRVSATSRIFELQLHDSGFIF